MRIMIKHADPHVGTPAVFDVVRGDEVVDTISIAMHQSVEVDAAGGLTLVYVPPDEVARRADAAQGTESERPDRGPDAARFEDDAPLRNAERGVLEGRGDLAPAGASPDVRAAATQQEPSNAGDDRGVSREPAQPAALPGVDEPEDHGNDALLVRDKDGLREGSSAVRKPRKGR